MVCGETLTREDVEKILIDDLGLQPGTSKFNREMRLRFMLVDGTQDYFIDHPDFDPGES